MKKFLFLLFSLFLSAQAAFAQQNDKNLSPQDKAGNALQEMQKTDPQSAQAFMSAIQRGDLAGAKKVYQDFKKAQADKQGGDNNGKTGDSTKAAAVPPPPSLFERTLSGDFPADLSSDLQQFGYDLFNKTVSTFTAPAMLPVGPDYLIGPGDQFTLTLWGTTEGIYNLQVTKEGEVTLPKVGVIPVAGLRFGELEKTLKRHLS